MDKFRGGFSLLEMIVSVAIIAVISTLLSQVFLSTLRTNSKTEALKDMKQNGELVMESITRSVQSASSITCNSSQSLSVTLADGSTIEYYCVSTVSQTRLVSTTIAGTQYMTSSNVTLGGTDCGESTLVFSCSEISGLPASVIISFQLANAGTSAGSFETASQSFQSSAVMRNNQ